MPQKKNPDMAELARGKTGRLYGNLISVLTTFKGLPSSYSRDLQEDKEALFDSVDTVRVALDVFAAMLPELTINQSRMEAAASDPALLATDLAEHLVGKGVPFREAHEITGRLVSRTAELKIPLDQLTVAQMHEVSPMLGDDARTVFDARAALRKRTAAGAPSPQTISKRIEYWRAQLR
jgi:argininosuccinate lyase